MKKLWKHLSEKQCAVICIVILFVIYGLEMAAVHFCEKNTMPFSILMGIATACPFALVFFLQGTWREK